MIAPAASPRLTSPAVAVGLMRGKSGSKNDDALIRISPLNLLPRIFSRTVGTWQLARTARHAALLPRFFLFRGTRILSNRGLLG